MENKKSLLHIAMEEALFLKVALNDSAAVDACW